MKIITLNKGGINEKKVNLHSIVIPDIWPVVRELKDLGNDHAAEMVLECWYLTHDLKRYINDQGELEIDCPADHDDNQLSLLSA